MVIGIIILVLYGSIALASKVESNRVRFYPVYDLRILVLLSSWNACCEFSSVIDYLEFCALNMEMQ